MANTVLRNLAAKSKLARFAVRYAENLDNRYLRAAIAATDGPAFYKRRLWKRYLTPDPAFQPAPLTPEFRGYLEQLREEGIVNIAGHFEPVAARLRSLIDEMALTGYRRQDDVTDWLVDVGFVVPEVMRMLTDPQLCGLFCNYYGRQAYYREHPCISGMSAGAPGVDRSSSHVHCDGYRQLTLHLLLNDVSATDTHLIYYAGTHKDSKLNYERVTGTSKLVEGARTVLGTGRAGTLAVFDSGSGYHRGDYRPGQRYLLQCVVTSGWLPFKDRIREDADALRGVSGTLPAHVRAMFERR
ncbi:MAG: hypothetical protein ACJ8R9_08840 [Steroidobacteraceae bacterium]